MQAVKDLTGSIVAYKDSKTGAMWKMFSAQTWANAQSQCSAYTAGGSYPGWSLPTLTQVQTFLGDGGLGVFTAAKLNIWTSNTAYVAPNPDYSTKKEHCAKSVANGGDWFWKVQTTTGATLCIRP